MAEKGGKGFPVSRKKVATRGLPSKQQAFKVRDNGPAQKDELVEIDSSDSESDVLVRRKNGTPPEGSNKASNDAPKSGKKASLESQRMSSSEAPASKGDLGKGGKPYNSGKAGGKGSLPQASVLKPPVTEVELKLEMDIPKSARVLMDCEAAAILQGIEESLTVLSDDPHIKMPESFSKALQYCQVSNSYTNIESARQVLDTLKTCCVTDGEICMIGNTCPESVNELYSLIPSLKASRLKNEGPITDVLSTLASFKQS
ncbi:DNA-directed RNA polymerases IV and V subunit 4-like isoform X1 [Iris pallida]|uniref:DNA-directed RNA polymerases IV and V subunit 4-like isoform X1 n=1 Tax=Iris pallida TaxID=29817 RepID=A0AAX6F9W4_IRIPA|nr:DNA-directed RNA polymerases IV and V subunit 4-like isoform X1 [Iris pallida]KAJ6813147.1 DNA-directed RNA polymerases IV and V subunit 4-like isoform X1 [Iris pallida]